MYDVRDRVGNRGQDKVTNINTGSGVFKTQQCMYKSEQLYINEILLRHSLLWVTLPYTPMYFAMKC